MLYLFESELPENKSVLFALTKIFGLGLSEAHNVTKKLGLNSNFKIKHVSKDQRTQLLFILDNLPFKVGNDLKKKKLINKKKLLSIKSYRGIRAWKGLPVRGQRTHTNARTSRKIK